MTKEEACKALTHCINWAKEPPEESFCDCIPVEALIIARDALEQHEGNIDEKFTLDEVAEIIYELFGDECACNYNDIDEYMYDKCQYSLTECPTPKEHLGCWKQYLIAKKKGKQNKRKKLENGYYPY